MLSSLYTCFCSCTTAAYLDTLKYGTKCLLVFDGGNNNNTFDGNCTLRTITSLSFNGRHTVHLKFYEGTFIAFSDDAGNNHVKAWQRSSKVEFGLTSYCCCWTLLLPTSLTRSAVSFACEEPPFCQLKKK